MALALCRQRRTQFVFKINRNRFISKYYIVVCMLFSRVRLCSTRLSSKQIGSESLRRQKQNCLSTLYVDNNGELTEKTNKARFISKLYTCFAFSRPAELDRAACYFFLSQRFGRVFLSKTIKYRIKNITKILLRVQE